MADNFYASIRGENLHGSLRWLSECYCEIRDESGEGCSTFRPVKVYIAGTSASIGHISYNGRVWDNAPGDLDQGNLLYDNRIAA